MPRMWTATVKVTATWEVEVAPEDEFEDEAEFESALQQGRFEDIINHESQYAAWDDYDLELLNIWGEPVYDGEDEDEDEDEDE